MSIKKVALEALKTKFEGLDESVLDRIAKRIAKTAKTEDDATAEVEDMTLQSLFTSYADSRATEAQDTAIKNYEKKYGLKDGKKEESDPDPNPNSPTNPNPNSKDQQQQNGKDDATAALLAELKAMREEIASIKAGKTTDARKSQLDALLKEASDATKKKYLREFSRSQFKDDDDFDAWLDEITPEIEAAGTDVTPKPNPQQQGRPKAGGGSGAGAVSPAVQARIDAYAKAAETQTSAIQGL